VNSLTTLLLSAAVGLAVSQASLAQDATMPPKSSGAPAADNSANNQPDRAGGLATADEQSNSKSDVDLTQRIRRSVMEDKNLSVYGQNVKIVAAQGKVTLNGVVRSSEEKQQIGAKAAAIAGKDKVMNELKVAPAN
jgi:osmotically-inducible protein OsmY